MKSTYNKKKEYDWFNCCFVYSLLRLFEKSQIEKEEREIEAMQ